MTDINRGIIDVTRLGPAKGPSDTEFADAEAKITAAVTAKQEARSKARISHLTVPAFFALDVACRPLVDAFGHSLYLVGSCMTRPDFRDVDLSLMLPDDRYAAMFPNKYAQLFLNAAVSDWLKDRTGLPVDFKFQDTTNTNEEHKGPRNPMGIRGELFRQEKA